MIFVSPDKIPSASEMTFESVFIAGGISKCRRWQDDIVALIATDKYDVFNPRRIDDFAKEGPAAAAQITWEYKALDIASSAVFWFPNTSVCPIALFELGKMLEQIRNNDLDRLIVGYEAGYERAFDLTVQLGLVKEKSSGRAEAQSLMGNGLTLVEGFDAFAAAVTKEFG